MRDHRSLDELMTPDARVLRFSPWGLLLDNREMKPEGSAQYLQDMVALELVPAVPEPVRILYDRLRHLFPYGLWAYDLFTVLDQNAYLALETALHYRFVESYHGAIPLEHRKTGTTVTLSVTHFDELQVALRPGSVHSYRDWDLKGHKRFDGSYAALLRWARKEHLFYGQRNYVRESALLDLRNLSAHPEPNLVSPIRAADAIQDLGYLINHLWDGPGGHLYPPELERHVMAVGVGTNDTPGITGLASMLSTYSTEFEVYEAVYLVLAVAGDRSQLSFNTRWLDTATTAYPIRCLWGPGVLREAIDALEQHVADVDWQPDTIQPLDQIFWVRRDPNGRWELPRRPEQMSRVSTSERSGVWFQVLADSPFDIVENIHRAGELPDVGENPVPKLPELMKAAQITAVRRCDNWQDVLRSL